MKTKPGKIYLIISILALALIFMVSCTSHPKETVMPASAGITDQLGRPVIIKSSPQRIISLSPSNTEILFALGLGDRVVGVTSYDDYPPQAKEKTSIGGFSTPNIEKIISLSPDLVVASAIHEKTIIPALEQRVTILALNPRTIDELLEAIAMTGKACGVEDNAARLVTGMQKRIKTITDKTSGLTAGERPKTFYVVWFSNEGLMVAGSSTLQDDIIVKAGGLNIGKDLVNYANIDIETVIGKNPDIMIIGIGMGSGADAPFQFAMTEPTLKDTSARQHDRIYSVDMSLAGRAGPRIVDVLEQFARCIHPEIFGPTAGK